VLDHMLNQAEVFGIASEDLGLEGLDPEPYLI